MTECLKSVQDWMDGVKLKLHLEKTVFIIIGHKAIRELLHQVSLSHLSKNISASVEIKNLDVIIVVPLLYMKEKDQDK